MLISCRLELPRALEPVLSQCLEEPDLLYEIGGIRDPAASSRNGAGKDERNEMLIVAKNPQLATTRSK
jgi:hypothetical protein